MLVRFAKGFQVLTHSICQGVWRTRLPSVAEPEPLVISLLLVLMVYDISNLYKIRFFTGEEVN